MLEKPCEIKYVAIYIYIHNIYFFLLEELSLIYLLLLLLLLFSLFSDWYGILNRVHRANNDELKDMKDESANVKNAVVCYTFFMFCLYSCTCELNK